MGRPDVDRNRRMTFSGRELFRTRRMLPYIDPNSCPEYVGRGFVAQSDEGYTLFLTSRNGVALDPVRLDAEYVESRGLDGGSHRNCILFKYRADGEDVSDLVALDKFEFD
jgi:hypothetical protein